MRLTSAQMDRACGVLLAQAAGDALGVPYEFARPPGPGQPAQMTGGGLGDYAPGEWSDDTQMATCIARVAATGADLSSPEALTAVANLFCDWYEAGPADIGNQTSAVLRAGAAVRAREGHLTGGRLTELAHDTARAAGRSAGNGALMRTGVVALAHLDDRDTAAAAARSVAYLTHHDELAGDSCVLWVEAIRVAVLERRLDVAAGLDLLPAPRRDRWATWLAEAATRPAAEFTPNGYTVTALQAAVAAISQTPVSDLDPAAGTFPCLHLQDALHAAVRVGDDTDTVAAIAGALLGAYWGSSAVPWQWRRAVHGWPDAARARDLAAWSTLAVRGGRPDAAGYPTGAEVYYGEPHTAAVPHPADPGVWLGTSNCGGHDADAVVSLCRVGVAEPWLAHVADRDLVEVRLMDSEAHDDNPNLEFVLADAAAAVAGLRAEGRTVLLHCVAAHQRTPSVAVAYARQVGMSREVAIAEVLNSLRRSARGHGVVWDAACR